MRRERGPRSEADLRRRTLSQNFLDEPGADQFARALPAGVAGDELCLEVGAGRGVLTERLARRYREVVAYEVDPNHARGLAARVAGLANVRIVAGDFLAAAEPAEPFQVAGNVPFSLTAPIVDWCLRSRRMTAATLITQLEYARKRTGAYGRWSLVTVRTWPELAWELRGVIPRTRFRPVPRVDAGILSLVRRPRPLLPPSRLRRYEQLVELGFGGVGGSLQASLARRHPAARVRLACQAAGVERGAVVAFVSPEQWLRLFEALEPGPPPGAGR